MPQPGPRIALIHAMIESIAPIRAAFAADWPEAQCFDLLDTSLSADLAHAGHLDAAMTDRFVTLSSYVAATTGLGGQTAAIQFTCSAFGPAIEAVKSRLSLPVLRPNEAAFDRALDIGPRIALVVTFAPALAALTSELEAMASARGQTVLITPIFADGALAALRAGDGPGHDAAVARACADLPPQDVVLLGQYSMARAAPALGHLPCPVITTPTSAVQALKQRLAPA